MNKIDDKLDYFNDRLENVETKCEKIDYDLSSKARAEVVEELTERVNDLINEIRNLEEFQSNYQKSAIMQESYDERLNILVHGVPENEETVWETREQTITKFKDFLYYGLKIADTDDIEFVDLHRLPQHPVKRGGKTINRPIIVKLLTMHDKNQIFSAVKNCENWENKNHPNIYITEHLPAKFQSQRKKLIKSKVFEETKKHRQKISWKAVDGTIAYSLMAKK